MSANRLLLLGVFLAVSLGSCMKEETAAPEQVVVPSATSTRTLEERIASGGKLYSAHCAACHQANGQGLAGAFPPLAESDYLTGGGTQAAAKAVLNGLAGPLTVNGKEYVSVMPNLSYLSDSEIADIVTFVFNSWGNPGGEMSAAEVAATRGGG